MRGKACPREPGWPRVTAPAPGSSAGHSSSVPTLWAPLHGGETPSAAPSFQPSGSDTPRRSPGSPHLSSSVCGDSILRRPRGLLPLFRARSVLEMKSLCLAWTRDKLSEQGLGRSVAEQSRGSVSENRPCLEPPGKALLLHAGHVRAAIQGGGGWGGCGGEEATSWLGDKAQPGGSANTAGHPAPLSGTSPRQPGRASDSPLSFNPNYIFQA